MNACFTSGQALFDASVPTSADQVDFCTTQACPDLLTALVRAAVADTSGTDYTKCSAIGGMGGFSNSICTKDGSGALCPFAGWMTTMTNIPAFKMFDAMNPTSSISQACVVVSFQRNGWRAKLKPPPLRSPSSRLALALCPSRTVSGGFFPTHLLALSQRCPGNLLRVRGEERQRVDASDDEHDGACLDTVLSARPPSTPPRCTHPQPPTSLFSSTTTITTSPIRRRRSPNTR